METESIQQVLKSLLPSLNAEFGVGKMWIVGSRARGDHRFDSDVDIMIDLERRGISLLGFCRLENLLSDKLGIKVDLVERNASKKRINKGLEVDALSV